MHDQCCPEPRTFGLQSDAFTNGTIESCVQKKFYAIKITYRNLPRQFKNYLSLFQARL